MTTVEFGIAALVQRVPAMVDIVLTPDQVAALNSAAGKIRFKSADGQLEVYAETVIRPVDWSALQESDREIILSRLKNPEGEFLTASEIVERMKTRFPE